MVNSDPATTSSLNGDNLKVLFVIHSLAMGGAERVTANLANYWASIGRDVIVVTVDSATSDFYRLDPRVTRVALGMAQEARSELFGLLNNTRRALHMRKILQSHRPDVAIGIMSNANILLAIASLGLEIVKIGTEHNYPPRSVTRKIWRMFRTLTYGSLDSVIALTSENAAWLKANTTARRVSVIANPISLPLSREQPVVNVESFGFRRGVPFVLCVGRLVPVKRFERAIEAFASQSSAFSDWRLVILGDGPLREHLENVAGELGIRSRVDFIGRVGNPADWLEASSLFLMTSHSEGFPNTLLEAMAHGVACISVDCDTGPRDLIQSGVNGVLVPQDDLEVLAAALGSLMSNAGERDKLGQAARETAQRFSVEQISQLWDAEFVSARADVQPRP